MAAASSLSTMLVLGLAACGGEPPVDQGAEDEPTVATAFQSAARRDGRPDAVEARRLIDLGRADLARPLVEALEGELGLEGPLLLARLQRLEGDEEGWVPFIARARQMDPSDPRPYATAAELYASTGKRAAAAEEIERGRAACGGLSPELQRARALLELVTPGVGRAQVGLELLDAAVREDPELPFTRRGFGQAYLLVAADAMGRDAVDEALELMERSLEYDPADRDARRTYGDMLIAGPKDFDRGLELLEEVLAEGENIGAELGRKYWSGGIFARLQGDLDVAEARFLRAQELGNLDVQQGTARTFMLERARAVLEGTLEWGNDRLDREVGAALTEALTLAGPPEEGARLMAAEFYSEAAFDALETGDRDRAGALARAATAAEPGSMETARIVGRLHFEAAMEAMSSKDYAAAAAEAEKAALATGSDPLHWGLYGELQHHRGKYREAADALVRAKEYSVGTDVEFGLRQVTLLAEALVACGEMEQAMAELDGALQLARAKDLAGVSEKELAHAENLLRLLRK